MLTVPNNELPKTQVRLLLRLSDCQELLAQYVTYKHHPGLLLRLHMGVAIIEVYKTAFFLNPNPNGVL
jgi:hypothetical protein